jgi:serine/threonine protein kinase
MFQLLSGVNFMHNCRVMHRDLKPANILVDLNNDQDIHIKIADLGMGRTYCLPIRPYSLEVVTLNYRAPELLLGA